MNLARLNFARLNHILVPDTKEERDRWRRGRTVRLFGKLFGFLTSFTTEGIFLAVVWLLTGVVSMNVVTQAYHFWGILTGVLVASYLLRWRFALNGVSIRVRSPRRATVGEDVPFLVELESRGQDEHRAIRIQGPFLPWDGQYVRATPSVPALNPGGRAQTVSHIRFAARGEHHLDPFHARALVPFGLNVGPAVSSGGTRIRIVPKIASVTRVSVPQAQRYQPGGVALASRTGESRELLGLRPYRPGDPLRDLHARAWARVGQPVVREYQQEYFTRIGVVIDNELGAGSDDDFEAALSLGAGVVAKLTRGEALIDLLVVGEHTLTLTLGRSLGFLEQALDLLACVEPGPALEPGDVERRLAPYLARLSALVFITLNWDPKRQRVVDWVRGQGVGCRVLRVGSSASPESQAADPTVLATHHIRNGKELLL